ncbi:hypothetical protein DSL72_006504 [Monilinia vaccinii-corymbosi]|uniref:2EXR domain-containing protein n=1 Tax=Monilinia vaccinii-corymbosi TaxID=61207 RepID=A0A8A3PNX8_9HELO|nr:hypothetical protein DSL72_006504 [Monilinia vaccinii-corymbosi]
MDAANEETQTVHLFSGLPPQICSSNTSNAPNEEMQSFHLFPNLPFELRRKVWRRTLRLFPRIIEVRPRTSNTAWDPLTTKHHVRATSPLILLSINHEARKELLPFHTALSSDVSLHPPPDSDKPSPNTSAKPLLVNFEVDAIYFNVAWDSTEAVPYLSFVQRLFHDFEQDKQLLRRLAVPGDSQFIRIDLLFTIFGELNDFQDGSANVEESVICKFDGLEELILVTEQRHLRVDMQLVALVENGEFADSEISRNLKDWEGQLMQGWRVPRITSCSTVAEQVKGRRVESQSSYLERVYGPDFVERFMATHD